MSLASLAWSLPTSVKPDFPEPAHICKHSPMHRDVPTPSPPAAAAVLTPRAQARAQAHSSPWLPNTQSSAHPAGCTPQRSQAVPTHSAAVQHSSAWLGISMCSLVGTHFSLGMYHPSEFNQLLKEQNIRFNGSRRHKAQRVQEGSWEAELQGAQPHRSGGKQLPAAHGRAWRKGANGTCWMIALQNKNRSVAQAGRR